MKELLDLARKAIEYYFLQKELDLSPWHKFDKKQSVFITIHKNKALRGCIGFPYPTHNLYEAVYKAAKSAAFEDPRFPPLEQKEMDKIKIEMSILTPPKKLTCKPEDYTKHIKVGKDGLIVKHSMHSGLLLPQVAKEHKWKAKEFLERTCEKAGLEMDQWKDSALEVYTFQANILHE